MASFDIPKNYSAPEGVKEGDEFKDIASFKIDGGKITIISLGEDGVPVGGKEEKPKGAKEAIKEQLKSMKDKEGSAKMDDTGEEESPEEDMAEVEEE